MSVFASRVELADSVFGSFCPKPWSAIRAAEGPTLDFRRLGLPKSGETGKSRTNRREEKGQKSNKKRNLYFLVLSYFLDFWLFRIYSSLWLAEAIAKGCGFYAYSWKLPAYGGAFLLTVDKFSFFAYSFSFFTYNWSFFAYSGKVRLIRAFRDCKQRSLSVSKKAPTVSKKASPQKKLAKVWCSKLL